MKKNPHDPLDQCRKKYLQKIQYPSMIKTEQTRNKMELSPPDKVDL